MLVPELPAYLEKIGGGEYKGLIISLFTLTAGISRPFSGKLADQMGRIPVMLFGAIVTAICGVLYGFVNSIFLFFLLRLFHGFSTGFTPTGSSAFVADIVPSSKRGEALGMFSLAGSLGMAAGPAIGSALALKLGEMAMFWSSTIMGLGSVLLVWNMKETLKTPKPFNTSMLKVSWVEIFEPRVIRPAIILILTSTAFGIVLTLTPDLSKHLGLENKGLFFTIFTISSLAMRFLAGKASDKYGRVAILRISSFVLGFAMFLLATANALPQLYIAGVLFGIGVGMNSPTVFAWAVDLSEPRYFGRALATVYIALEIGIGGGALLGGWLYANNPNNFFISFLAISILCFSAFIYLVFRRSKVSIARRKIESRIFSEL